MLRRWRRVYFIRRIEKNSPLLFLKTLRRLFITTFCLITLKSTFYELQIKFVQLTHFIIESARNKEFSMYLYYLLSFTITLFSFKLNLYVEVSVEP